MIAPIVAAVAVALFVTTELIYRSGLRSGNRAAEERFAAANRSALEHPDVPVMERSADLPVEELPAPTCAANAKATAASVTILLALLGFVGTSFYFTWRDARKWEEDALVLAVELVRCTFPDLAPARGEAPPPPSPRAGYVLVDSTAPPPGCALPVPAPRDSSIRATLQPGDVIDTGTQRYQLDKDGRAQLLKDDARR